MSYAAIAGKLLDGYPKTRLSSSSRGETYKYQGTFSTLSANLPEINDIWAGGLAVSGREFYRVGRSDLGELIVETDQPSYGGSSVSSVLDEVRYSNNWQPNDIPLEQHPAFIPGGANDLFAAASGTPTRTHIADVFGWENERDVTLKYAYKYKIIDSNGVPATTATSLTASALAFAKLRNIGVSTIPAFLPCWRKIGSYTGSVAPGVGSIGQYTANPDGTGYPTGYQWVKIADDAERIGRGLRWERTEAWQGYKKVWFDVDTINPASNTLP
jgi:hypothetical protein